MITNRKFEKAAHSRQFFAFWVAVGLHLAVAAAVIYSSELASYLPDFIREFFAGSTPAEPPIVP